jgi:hypothetical protein
MESLSSAGAGALRLRASAVLASRVIRDDRTTARIVKWLDDGRRKVVQAALQKKARRRGLVGDLARALLSDGRDLQDVAADWGIADQGDISRALAWSGERGQGKFVHSAILNKLGYTRRIVYVKNRA